MDTFYRKEAFIFDKFTTLSNTYSNFLFNFDSNIKDCLQHHHLFNFVHENDTDLNQRIGRNFKHITVNPSKPSQSKLILNSYVFAKNIENIRPGLDTVDELNTRILNEKIANLNENSVRNFTDDLINSSKLERARSLGLETTSHIGRDGHLYFLTGDRGVGKTFFLTTYLQTNLRILTKKMSYGLE